MTRMGQVPSPDRAQVVRSINAREDVAEDDQGRRPAAPLADVTRSRLDLIRLSHPHPGRAELGRRRPIGASRDENVSLALVGVSIAVWGA